MEKLIELLKQIQELAGVGVDALQGAGEGGGKPHEGGKPPEGEGGGRPPGAPGGPDEGNRPPGR